MLGLKRAIIMAGLELAIIKAGLGLEWAVIMARLGLAVICLRQVIIISLSWLHGLLGRSLSKKYI